MNSFRQPVIISDTELSELNEENPGFIRPEDTITYGSTSDKKQTYMCPRYWCLKTNKPIDPKTLTPNLKTGELEHIVRDESGKVVENQSCGKILDSTATEVEHGRYIYDFTAGRNIYPGLISNKHPDGHCLPCCFKKWDTANRKDENRKCINKNKKEKEKEKEKETVNDTVNDTEIPLPIEEEPVYTENDVYQYSENGEKLIVLAKNTSYVLAADTTPISPGRLGYLPIPVTQILRTLNEDCQKSVSDSSLKQNHPCLIRYGVEINTTQSFVAAISTTSWISNIAPLTQFPLSVDEFKKSIVKCLTRTTIHNGEYGVDMFLKLQNGNLVTTFSNKNHIPDINLEEFNRQHPSNVFNALNMKLSSDRTYYLNIASAFKSFVSFVLDPTGIIDHTYLWDLVSLPNNDIFPSGVNLVVFNIPDNDITTNIEIVCPTSISSSQVYTHTRPYIFLVKHYEYYEPIYSYVLGNGKYEIISLFNEKSPLIPSPIKTIIDNVIKPFIKTTCTPRPSIKTEWSTPLSSTELILKLSTYDYTPRMQIMNFNNKVIGIFADAPLQKNSDSILSGFIPCAPSAVIHNDTLPYQFMNESSGSLNKIDIWKSYDNTIHFLFMLNRRSGKRRDKPDIPCKPVKKLVEDGFVVGILTETNQLIQINEPILESDINWEYRVPTLNHTDYLVHDKKTNTHLLADTIITTSNKVDIERTAFVTRIKSETKFYGIFRSTLKTIMHKYSNRDTLTEIKTLIESPYIIFQEKRDRIQTLLSEIAGNAVQFSGDENYYKLVDSMSMCITKSKKECSNSTSSNFCGTTNNGCSVILPKKHVLSGRPNRAVYFSKLADELARYTRVNSILLNASTHSTFGNVGYDVRDDEIILFQSILESDYLDKLVEARSNRYARQLTRDEAIPITSILYPNSEFLLDELKNNKLCPNAKIKRTITSSHWRSRFPAFFGEKTYGSTFNCTFKFIIDIIETVKGVTVDRLTLENKLYTVYMGLFELYKTQILDILSMEGKFVISNNLARNIITFTYAIHSPEYFLSPTDLWILLDAYEIPSIFISQSDIIQSDTGTPSLSNRKIFVTYASNTDSPKSVFIILPSIRKYGGVPVYKTVTGENEEIEIKHSSIKNTCKLEVDKAVIDKITIKEFFEYLKKKPINKK
jgi:hypothetical protein